MTGVQTCALPILAVVDTGAGIDAEACAHIFERYTQAASGRVDGGGTGLGLAIAKEIAVGHGGTIDVESEPGQGSTFTVVVPVG